MQNYRRAKTKGATYFFTLVTYRRQRLLCDNNVREELRNGILAVRKKDPFTIDGWMLLPDHIHYTCSAMGSNRTNSLKLIDKD